MLSRSRLTQLRSLRQKKFRRENGLFVAEGTKLVLELLASDFVVESVFAKTEWLKIQHHRLKNVEDVIAVDDDELSRISSLVTPQDVLAIVQIPAVEFDFGSLEKNYCIVLDGIRDPGNFGTIIRVADWFGMHDMVCSPDCAEVWNPKVVQASMGSLTRVRVHEFPLPDFFRKMNEKYPGQQAIPVYGTFLEGKSIYETAWKKNGVVVIGNESAGIRPETEKFITERITIPAFPGKKEKGAESLNAAVATSITISEIRRNLLEIRPLT